MAGAPPGAGCGQRRGVSGRPGPGGLSSGLRGGAILGGGMPRSSFEMGGQPRALSHPLWGASPAAERHLHRGAPGRAGLLARPSAGSLEESEGRARERVAGSRSRPHPSDPVPVPVTPSP